MMDSKNDSIFQANLLWDERIQQFELVSRSGSEVIARKIEVGDLLYQQDDGKWALPTPNMKFDETIGVFTSGNEASWRSYPTAGVLSVKDAEHGLGYTLNVARYDELTFPRPRRINLWGAGGCGKSTTAAKIFAQMKEDVMSGMLKKTPELVREFVKEWAWENRKPVGFDQCYIMGEQIRREEMLLRNGVDLIVTDSPVTLGVVYAIRDNLEFVLDLLGIAQKFNKKYKTLDIFLDRGDKPYVQAGRFESEQGAAEMDTRIKRFLEASCIQYHSVRFDQFDAVMNVVRKECY